MSVLLVDNALALKSMRNSDFDAYSAFGEVLDNSIQADAKQIDIKVHYTPKSGKAFEPILKIGFCDDGHGMNEEVLHRCLQLGYSSRYNDRSGIGRFGVGMTLGAINQCKRIEVYSKVKGGVWNWTYIDLDEIEAQHENDEATGIPAPIQKDVPKEYSDFSSLSSGTIVVWSSYDRQPDRASRMIDEMRIWFGRTFRFFIWDGVNIRLNGTNVCAVDPLYARTEKTAFPNDPRAEVFPEIVLSWPVPLDDQIAGGPDKSDIRISMSLLPVEFRPTAGSGGSKEARDRLIDRNEGLSIVRNRREVFYGEVPYWPTKNFFEEIDRWWGCEIHFDAVLDKVFTVKNIKRGAVPVRELKESIAEHIGPTKKTVLERVREVWNRAKAEEAIKGSATAGIDTGHSIAEKIAKKTATPTSQIDTNKKLDDEAEALAQQIGKNEDEQVQQRWALKFKSQPFTIVDDMWKGATFLDVHHLGGKDVLQYNVQHVFFQAFKEIRDNIDQGVEVQLNAVRMKALVDLLLISYAKAESMFEAGLELTVEDFIEQLKTGWGQYLNNYMKTWKSEEGM